ncbi:MAG TPA: DUF4270 family protein [Chryseosolibacter sp.]|nr:DUF4270 family protein [Chryseosolibacter sp.]
MNLWDRTLRQLAVVAVALFFFSCEDETSLLGFKNPNKKFDVSYVDIPLNVSQVLAIDSVVTDLRPIVVNAQARAVDGLVVGQYQDPEVGSITAQSFLTIYPTVNSQLQSSAVFDSVTVQFRLNAYAYGFTGAQQKTFKIHEITGDTLTLFNGNTYYSSSAAPQYSADPLGLAVASVHYDSLQKQAALPANQQDTVLMAGRLSDEYGQRIFEAIRAGFTSSAQARLFKAQIKGLAVLPGDEPGILGLNVGATNGQLSRVILHYHTLTDAGAVDDTLSRTFATELSSFSRIEADRTGTELAGILPYQSMDTQSGLRYVQSGAGLLTKVDLAPFWAFADTVDNVLINSAELSIGNVSASLGMKPHNGLMLALMKNETDQLINSAVAADREVVGQYYSATAEGTSYFFAGTDAGGSIEYDADENRFSGFLTLFAQSLFGNKNNDDGTVNQNRLKYVALYPVNPPIGRSVTRTVFSKDNISLRIYYTRANPVAP